MHDYWFGHALGEFRLGVGTQVALMAVAYGLDVEDQLAQTLPQPDAGFDGLACLTMDVPLQELTNEDHELSRLLRR